MSRKPVSVSEDSYKIAEALAKKRDMTAPEAVDHLVRVGHSRIKALANHAKVTKAAKPKKKPERAAKKKATKPKKAKDPSPATPPATPDAPEQELGAEETA